jgi:hydrogenase small subunit
LKKTTFYELLVDQGFSRRDFLGFCALTATTIGLGASGTEVLAAALETKPRLPVLWLHGLECTCCSESFIRAAHPLAQDIILSMISLDYDDTLMVASGAQAESILDEIATNYKGNYILAVEGNAPLADGGTACLVGGRPFVDQLTEVAHHAKAVVAWGTCASFGCVQAAYPNPTQATPVSRLIKDRPVINVPGCPPIAEVMAGLLAYIIAFDRMPELDRQLRPKMFYGQRIHDKCYRRAHFDAGQFVETWDDDGARQGWCLYKLGCRGPTTYNACTTIGWNDGVSSPIRSGHGCLGCSEDGFWDRGPFYERVVGMKQFGIEATADQLGLAAMAGLGTAMAAHAGVTAVRRALAGRPAGSDNESEGAGAGDGAKGENGDDRNQHR